jgi:hypothetical protein
MGVRRGAHKVWIEGVPALAEPGLKVPWLTRTSKTCTFAGALEAALSLTECPYSYEEIMVLSGMAFRTRWYDGENGPTGCPCAPVGETPDVKKRLPAAIGWQIDEYGADGWDKPIMREAKEAVVRSIDADQLRSSTATSTLWSPMAMRRAERSSCCRHSGMARTSARCRNWARARLWRTSSKAQRSLRRSLRCSRAL